MGQFAISMPQLGESIAEATLLRLKVKPGEKVEMDQEVAEVETSKAVMSVTTSYGGVWKEWKAKEGRVMQWGLFLDTSKWLGAQKRSRRNETGLMKKRNGQKVG